MQIQSKKGQWIVALLNWLAKWVASIFCRRELAWMKSFTLRFQAAAMRLNKTAIHVVYRIVIVFEGIPALHVRLLSLPSWPS
jgi:hypothetical protein